MAENVLTIITIFDNLRDPNKVNEAQGLLTQQILSSVNSLPLLFEIFTIPQQIHNFNITFDSISYCIRTNKNSIDENCLQFVRSKLIELLSASDGVDFLAHLLNVISICNELFPQPWEELFAFAFANLNQPNPETINAQLQLINLLFPSFSDEIIQQYFDNINQFLIFGFQCENSFNQSIAVELASKISLKTQNIEFATQVRPFIHEVFTHIAAQSTQQCTKIVNAVTSIEKFECTIIDIGQCIIFSHKVLNTAEASFDLKQQMLLLLMYCLEFHQIPIEGKGLQIICSTLMKFQRAIFPTQEQDSLLWIVDISDCLRNILVRLSTSQIAQCLNNTITSYLPNPDPSIRLFPLVLLYTALDMSKTGLFDVLAEIFPHLIEVLQNEPCEMIQRYLCELLSVYVLDHPELIETNFDFLTFANQYFIANPMRESSLMLSAFVNAYDDTDQIFEIEYPVAKEMIDNSSSIIAYNAIDILNHLIDDSSNNYLLFAQDIIQFVGAKFENDFETYCILLDPLSRLFAKRNFDDNFPIIFQAYLAGLSTGSDEIIIETFIGMSVLLPELLNAGPIEVFQEFQTSVVPLLEALYQAYKDRFEFDTTILYIYNGIIMTLRIMSFLCGINADICSIFLNCIQNGLETFDISNDTCKELIGIIVKNLKYFLQSLSKYQEEREVIFAQSNICDLIQLSIQHLFYLMNDKRVQYRQKPKLALSVSRIIQFSGIDRIGIDPNEIFVSLYNCFHQFSLCNPLVCPDDSILEPVDTFIVSFDLLFQSFHEIGSIENISPIKELLETQIHDIHNDRFQISLVVYPLLIKYFGEHFEDQNYIDLIQLLGGYIQTLSLAYAIHSCNFLSLIVPIITPTNLSIISKSCSPTIMPILLQRFAEINSTDYLSVMLKEALIVTICSFLFGTLEENIQLIPMILENIPFSYPNIFSDTVYQLLNMSQPFIKNDANLRLQLCNRYVQFLSQSNIIGQYIYCLMSKYIFDMKNDQFTSDDQFQEYIGSILDNDETRISYFNRNYSCNLADYQRDFEPTYASVTQLP